jgi:hypothetical protein
MPVDEIRPHVEHERRDEQTRRPEVGEQDAQRAGQRASWSSGTVAARPDGALAILVRIGPGTAERHVEVGRALKHRDAGSMAFADVWTTRSRPFQHGRLMSRLRQRRLAMFTRSSARFVLMLALATAAPANGRTVAVAQVAGTVTDESGGALPGAEVTVTQTNIGFTRFVITGSQGDYVLNNPSSSKPLTDYRDMASTESWELQPARCAA